MMAGVKVERGDYMAEEMDKEMTMMPKLNLFLCFCNRGLDYELHWVASESLTI